MKLNIRPLEMSDFPQWLPLWDGNNMDQRDEAVTSETWSRLTDPASTVHGLCAMDGETMVGLVHYITHPTTGNIAPVCYMQDVYVNPDLRRKGIARQLVIKLLELAKAEKYARVYWLAEENNEAAQALYKDIGVKIPFSLHVMMF